MNNIPLTDLKALKGIQFIPLSEAKAKLSEVVRKSSTEKYRVVITTNGRPSCILLPYEECVELLNRSAEQLPVRRTTIETWKKEKENRQRIRQTITSLFDISRLTRKGQKKYKKEWLDEYTPSS